jgi:hypothetical protein
MIAIIGYAASVSAQSSWTYSGRLTAESTSNRTNPAHPLAAASDSWNTRMHIVTTGDAAWTTSERFRVAGALAGIGRSNGTVEGRVRELYGRASAASWLDVEVGKRVLRWGVGYGFSPAGLLDPPRVATDPGDRLQLNEGRLLARADVYHGGTSMTLAVAERRTAARLSTVVGGGLEIAAIGAAIKGRRPSLAATLTHVVGQQLEWHVDAAFEDHEHGRALTAAAGVQYTFTQGVNIVVEYHRDGRGFNDAGWNEVLAGRRSPGERPTRQNSLFTRVARASADAAIIPELIVIAGLDDGGWTVVPSVAWTAHRRVQAHVRATWLVGPTRAVVSLTPFSTSVTAGAVLRF